MNALSFILTNNKSWITNNFVLSLIIYQISFIVIQLIIFSLMSIFPNNKIKKEFNKQIDFTKISSNNYRTTDHMIGISFICFLLQIPSYFSQLIFSLEGYGVFVFVSSFVYILISWTHLFIQMTINSKLHTEKFERTQYYELNRLKFVYKPFSYKSFKITFKNKTNWAIKMYDLRSKIHEYKIFYEGQNLTRKDKNLMLITEEKGKKSFTDFNTIFNNTYPQECMDELFLEEFYQYLSIWSSFFRYTRRFNRKSNNFKIEITDKKDTKIISLDEFKEVLLKNSFALLYNKKTVDRTVFEQAERYINYNGLCELAWWLRL
ncbi:hypothetical protein [Mycoplasma sp. HU2014]|uniref:hypothetical protein n=1 Tax=Mycoplasma sp. HU2014 TaxID=1664275 RepID=UPI00067CF69E|nr:hypothetical protein [Mycoplasma sp. HU2014]KNG79358.1 membrane protein [Mycoplasma sp. HU2014]